MSLNAKELQSAQNTDGINEFEKHAIYQGAEMTERLKGFSLITLLIHPTLKKSSERISREN